MENIECKKCTRIINGTKEDKYNNKVFNKEDICEEKDYLLVSCDGKEATYDLLDTETLFFFTDLKANKLYKDLIINNKQYFLFTNPENDLLITDNLNKALRFKSRCYKTKITKKKIYIYFLGFLESDINNLNEYGIEFSFKLGNYVIKRMPKMPVVKKTQSRIKKMLNRKNYYKLEIDLKNIIDNEEDVFVNNSLCFSVIINGQEILYPIKKTKIVRKSKYNYLPIKKKKIDNYYVMIRKSVKQNIMIIKRELEEIEYNKRFKFYESKFMTIFFKLAGALYKKVSKKTINLYFEKFASKAEEGTFELFEMARDNSKNSKNYYIIEDTIENKEYLQKKNVCAKHSFKYYFLTFASSNIISTEAPTHLNLLRTANRMLKKNIYDKKFIFLQHGITYLKCQGKNSSFTKGKEAYPDLIVVSSKKEAVVVREAMEVQSNGILVTGMCIFDKIDYNHINQKSKDKIVIMLTWKPYEEQFTDFTKSTYYQYTLDIYNMLKKVVDVENISIVPHPKVKEKMLSCPFASSIYDGMISEVVKDAKLLITDYSSICYNSFYQGAGVVFYQPDLEIYEEDNGPLIPKNNEYIGYRCFNKDELNKVINEGIKDTKIDLNYYRRDEFIKNYNTINEFHDGKNTTRIYEKLKKKNII